MAEITDDADFYSSVQKKVINTHGSCSSAEGNSDPKFHNDSYERGSSKGRVRERDRQRHYERSQRDHIDKREQSGRNRIDGDHHRNRDHDRRRSYDRDGEERHRRSRSRSRSKRKRYSGFDDALPLLDGALAPPRVYVDGRVCKRDSGFDVAPPLLDGAAAPPTIPGAFPNNMTQQAARHARRVYVGGLPSMANEQLVATFFSQVMSAIGGNTAGPGDAVINVYINHEKNFAFVEMRSVEEAGNAMALDGIIFEGAPVKVRRPSDYNLSLAAALGPSQPSQKLNLEAVGILQGSTGGIEGSDRIFVGGLPYYVTEVQIRELLESFGPLRGFDLVKDKVTGNSKGHAFCVYQDTSIMDVVCASLNGLRLGYKTLTVRRANQGAIQPKPEHENVLLQVQQQLALQRLVFQAGAIPTKVVRLTQDVGADELKDDEEYEDIVEDMRLEAGKYGSLTSVIIPRPMANEEPSPGVGRVFLEFSDTNGALKAPEGLNGRKFGGNEVVPVYYPQNKFLQGEYDA
ncbi:hypothetical protein MKX01_013677 [Papaver californicum]|nr:hypothetical protein MKX01_013677 [Papaver californicum]